MPNEGYLLQPNFRVTVNGADITRSMDNRLISLTLTDNREDDADELIIELGDEDGQLDIPVRGVEIEIWLGYGDNLINKGVYVVDEIEHSGTPDKLTIKAKAADLREGVASKREQSWHRTTIGKIVKTIAARNKLKPACSGKLASVPVDHMDQSDESDISFLQRLARLHDATATVKHKNLLFIPMAQATTASGQPLPQVTLTRRSGDQHTFKAQDRDGARAVRAYYSDHGKGDRAEIVVHDKAKKKNKKTESSAEDVKSLRHVYASRATAKKAAEAELQKAKRGVATFTLTLACGRPEITSELPITVSGFKNCIDGQGWIASRVTHSLSEQGLTTQIEMESRDAVDPEESPAEDDE